MKKRVIIAVCTVAISLCVVVLILGAIKNSHNVNGIPIHFTKEATVYTITPEVVLYDYHTEGKKDQVLAVKDDILLTSNDHADYYTGNEEVLCEDRFKQFSKTETHLVVYSLNNYVYVVSLEDMRLTKTYNSIEDYEAEYGTDNTKNIVELE